LGPFDSSPDRISEEEVSTWQAEQAIEYLGETNDVVPYIEQCHIYTLPSYHEGLPRTVLEAMAVGRPILTTDAVGCRDTIFENKSDSNSNHERDNNSESNHKERNGFLVPIKNSEQLANKMIWFVEHQQQWSDMANASRYYAGEYFDVHKVNMTIANIMQINCQKLNQ
jgi:glycosyltransferase involved in cell wall biosynthesis